MKRNWLARLFRREDWIRQAARQAFESFARESGTVIPTAEDPGTADRTSARGAGDRERTPSLA